MSEATNTPVMLQVRVRSCHMTGEFIAKDNKRPDFTLSDATGSWQHYFSPMSFFPAPLCFLFLSDRRKRDDVRRRESPILIPFNPQIVVLYPLSD